MAKKSAESAQTSTPKPDRRIPTDRFAGESQSDSVQNASPPPDLAKKTTEFIEKNTAAAKKNIEKFLEGLTPLTQLGKIETELQTVQRDIANRLQAVLSGLVGYSGGSFEANQDVARRIQALFQQLNVRAKCPKSGLPGNLRHRRAGGAKHGMFVIEVTVDGKRSVHSSSATVPSIDLVPAPADARKSVS
jgi:uncharacterized phage infection (PIP) family protein YhgE